MSILIWVALWLGALTAGTIVGTFSRARERRWAVVGALSVAFVGAVGLGLSTSWGAHATTVGPFLIDSVVSTVAPTMLLGAVALVLLAGRAEATGPESSWLLVILAVESVALASSSFGLLVAAEIGAAALLADHARRNGHRAQVAYLLLTLGLLVAAAVTWGMGLDPRVSAWLSVGAALVRLGVFPLSTGILASLQQGTSTATLMAALPFGGVMLLLRAAPILEGASVPVLRFLLVAAPVAAALSILQRELGRSIGYVLVAVHALIAVGALAPSTEGHLGAELLWAGALLTSTGFGAAANLVTLRIGNPDLDRHHGLHGSAPFLSLAFLVLGVGLAGGPGTIEFVAEDVLLNTTAADGVLGMAMVVLAIELIGFNMLRLHYRLFFGARREPRAWLNTKPRERLGLAIVATAVVFGGLAPSLLPLVSAATQTAGH